MFRYNVMISNAIDMFNSNNSRKLYLVSLLKLHEDHWCKIVPHHVVGCGFHFYSVFMYPSKTRPDRGFPIVFHVLQEAQLPLRNRASAIYFFLAKLLSIAVMTCSYDYHIQSLCPMIWLIYYAHGE